MRKLFKGGNYSRKYGMRKLMTSQISIWFILPGRGGPEFGESEKELLFGPHRNKKSNYDHHFREIFREMDGCFVSATGEYY